MKSKKAVRSALGMSVLSIALCAAMLIGTTFAWFTDTASTAVNKIQAGTLKVDIVKAENGDSIKGQSMSFVNQDGSDDILWEPGVTFRTPAFQIKNIGTLAIKYKLALSGVTGSSKLLKVIQFSVVKNDGTTVDLDKFEGTLTLEGDSVLSEPLYIQGHMEETAGNEYQNETLEGLGITVYATQYTYEYDSKDNQYDFDSDYTKVIAAGKTFSDGTHVISTGITATDKNAIAVKAAGANTNVTITGGTFDGGSGGNNQCVHVREGATVTIKGGTFTVGSDASGEGNSVIESNGGNIIIEGGFFQTDYHWRGFYYVLNQQNNNPGTITVKGGTFVNYDPSKGDDNLGGNFVAEGYSVLPQTQPNGDIWYTVVNGEAAGSQEDLKDVIGNLGENGGNVTLGSGTYTLHNVNKTKTQNTTLTLEGAGADKTTFTAGDLTVTDASGEGSSDYSYEGSDVTFKNMTINVGTGNYKGFVRAKSLYFENCTIVGRGSYWGSGTVVFKNCKFVADANDYNLWTYSGASFVFDGCTFDSAAGKFVNAYKEQSVDTKLEFTNCKFNAGTTSKPAVCLKAYQNVAWDVTFSNCTTQNAATDSTTNSKLYSIESGMNTATTVTIDGVVAWANGTTVQ